MIINSDWKAICLRYLAIQPDGECEEDKDSHHFSLGQEESTADTIQ